MTWIETAVLVGIGVIAFLDRWPVLQSMVSRPLVVGAAVGVTLGDPTGGALWGALFEVMYLGLLPVGASRLPDAGLAALAGTTVALTGVVDGVYPAGLAGASGWLAGHLGEAADRLQRRWNGALARWARSAAAAGETSVPGRAMVAAVGAASLLGATVSVVAVVGGAGASAWLSGGAWAGPLDGPTVRVLVAAGLAVSGARAFFRRGADAIAWGGAALAGALVVWGTG
ncbi:MAG: PTS sugar transporter subunit IIC [Gemmatimonadota bacterium]|nr:PTS sugar transporter subunit IIC [Gemmatimonadota bacterium]